MLINGLIQVAESYIDMLDTHKPYWRTVLENVRDEPEKPLLVHCTGMFVPDSMSALTMFAL